MTKQEACDFLRDLAERLREIPVIYGTDEGDIDQLEEVAASIESEFGIKDHRMEEVLRRINGTPDAFRPILSDRTELLSKVCDYADILADRRRTEPWVIMQDIFGHGSSVSAALFDLYRKER